MKDCKLCTVYVYGANYWPMCVFLVNDINEYINTMCKIIAC